MEVYTVLAASKNGKSKSGGKGSSARRKPSDAERRQREIAGVILIAIGVLLTLYLCFSATGALGKWLSGALFGLFGWLAYVLPAMFVLAGILSIRGGVQNSLRSAPWLTALGMLALVTLVQVSVNLSYESMGYMEYIDAACDAGAAVPHRGGGFVGSAIGYPLLKLGGKALGYTLPIVIILVVILVITRFSIRDLAEKTGETLLHAIESTQETQAEDASSAKKPFTVVTLDENAFDEDDDIFDRMAKRKAKRRAAREAKAKKKAPLAELDLELLPTEG
ncbi:MAG: DNA translocase FtsK 4TM domain-containing protein, partial [Clostridia bacterium]|nr:DNA translocase FtsK 4TM domain-containing protein [Clostridia bacterium]